MVILLAEEFLGILFEVMSYQIVCWTQLELYYINGQYPAQKLQISPRKFSIPRYETDMRP